MKLYCDLCGKEFEVDCDQEDLKDGYFCICDRCDNDREAKMTNCKHGNGQDCLQCKYERGQKTSLLNKEADENFTKEDWRQMALDFQRIIITNEYKDKCATCRPAPPEPMRGDKHWQTIEKLRRAYCLARNAAAGLSNYCEESASTRACEKELAQAEEIYRTIDFDWWNEAVGRKA